MPENNILPEFQDFLLNNGLVHEQYVPYYAQWVTKFLSFSERETASDGNSLVDNFLHSVQLENKILSWQVRQAEEAVQLYVHKFINNKAMLEAKNSEDFWKDIPDIQSILEETTRILRIKKYAFSTERLYLDWIKRFFSYLQEARNISDGHSGVILENAWIESSKTESAKTENYSLENLTQESFKSFLSYLANEQKVSASTHNQAFDALIFLFREVLKKDVEGISGPTIRIKREKQLPVLLTVDEVWAIFQQLSGQNLLIANLFYGSGLRLMELASLRIRDIDFESDQILVRNSKGETERTTILPKTVKNPLFTHISRVKELYDNDIAAGYGEVSLPVDLELNSLCTGFEWNWQYAFPSSRLSLEPGSGKIRRQHLSDKAIQMAIGNAVKKAGITKNATVHTLRHSFAAHLLMNGVNIKEVQGLLGHKSIARTQIYVHALRDMKKNLQSPLDAFNQGYPTLSFELEEPVTGRLF